MAAHKLSISLSSELDMALMNMCLRRGMNKSRVIELLLREHPEMAPYIRMVREEPAWSVAAASSKSRAKARPRTRSRPRRAVSSSE